jgi:aldehyde dehydrogenase (NAD+)
MENFKPPKVDLSKYALPLKAFIGGSFVDSAVDDRHTLQSSVNDATITHGL